jgi:hypothetical protein
MIISKQYRRRYPALINSRMILWVAPAHPEYFAAASGIGCGTCLDRTFQSTLLEVWDRSNCQKLVDGYVLGGTQYT